MGRPNWITEQEIRVAKFTQRIGDAYEWKTWDSSRELYPSISDTRLAQLIGDVEVLRVELRKLMAEKGNIP